jgi:superfamily I DNA/RNA helicase
LAARIREQADCLRAIAEEMDGGSVETLGGIVAALCAPTSGGVVLSTIHRAKGLEWDLVLHLNPDLIPSPQAEEEGGDALQQEENLLYVAETRARRGLALVQLADEMGGGAKG